MVLDYFREISNVPRGSGNNKGISDFLVEFAKEKGLRYYQDSAYNVVIYKDASKGYENCPPLILQGHMDMVCEKTPESTHDFLTDPIDIVNENNILRAKDTTLGADDGIAVAYMLDILADDSLVHPPLEMLITSDEEVGMLGAIALDKDCLSGRHMINLDSEDEGIFVCACAGGIRTHFLWDIQRVPVCGLETELQISGLLGGHSGTDIDKNRSNAVMLAGRLLTYLSAVDYSIIDITGGNKDNVIPNECTVKLCINLSDYDKFSAEFAKYAELITNELGSSEPNLTIIASVTECSMEVERTCMALSGDMKDKLLRLFNILPNGVHTMSADICGMVESSSNLGIMRTEEDYVKVCVSVRSQKQSYIDYICKRLSVIADMLGASFDTAFEYPGWDIKPKSDFRDMLCSTYRDMTGTEPVVTSIHAGLEGGVFFEKMPDMDIVSIGPDARNVHTVNEYVDIASVERVYEYLRRAIEAFAEKYR